MSNEDNSNYAVVVSVKIVDRNLIPVKDLDKAWIILASRDDSDIHLGNIEHSDVKEPPDEIIIRIELICDENEYTDFKEKDKRTFDKLPYEIRSILRDRINEKAKGLQK